MRAWSWLSGWIAHRPRIDGACYVRHEVAECTQGRSSTVVVVVLIFASAIVVYAFVFVRRDNVRSILRPIAPALGVAAAVGAAALAYSWR